MDENKLSVIKGPLGFLIRMKKRVVFYFNRIIFLFVFMLFISSFALALEFNKKWEVFVGSPTPLSYGDVDGDGKDEIVLGAGKSIQIISSDGTVLKSLSLQKPVSRFAPIGLANLDKSDNELELVAVIGDIFDKTTHLEVYKLNGKLLWKTSEIDNMYCRAAPSIDDVDLDGYYELIFPCGRLVYGFNHDGTTLEGWPVDLFEVIKVQRAAELEADGIEAFTRRHEISAVSISPAIGELDLADDNPEIVIAASQYVFTLNHDAKLYWIGWDTNDNFGLGLGDINGDNVLEVVVTTFSGGEPAHNPIAYSHDGTFLWGVNYYSLSEGVSLGQFDFDFTLDILVKKYDFAGFDNLIFILNGEDGKYLQGGQGKLNLYTPLIADFDGDGIDEIVTTGNPAVPGDPSILILDDHVIEITSFGDSRALTSSAPIIGDIDKNDKLEVIFVSADSKLYAYESNQERPLGKLSWPMYWHDARHTANYETPQEDKLRFIRGDVDGDGRILINDPIFILSYLFLGGEQPNCFDAADIDDDGIIAINDPISLLAHLFLGGPAPPSPYPDAGFDPTDDMLSCN